MPDLISERRGEVLIVTFNRPEKRNALSDEMLQILEQTLDQAAEDETLRALILTGAGNKSFSSGIDLGLFVRASFQQSQRGENPPEAGAASAADLPAGGAGKADHRRD